MEHELRLLQLAIRMLHSTLVRRLVRHWCQVPEGQRANLVVSLIPNFNRALHDSVRQALPGTPFVTVLTDLADLPPHFWIETGQVQDLICGSGEAYAQALKAGHVPHRVLRASGMILRPDFYRAGKARGGDGRPARMDGQARADCLALGLDPDRPLGVLMFGGVGSRRMIEVCRVLPDLQLLVLCGRNDALVRQVQALDHPARRAALGFTTEVARFLRLGDFFIGKPGPGSMSEALQMGLPVITFENAATMPQERWNARWIREAGLGLTVRSLRQLPEAVAHLLGQLDTSARAVASHDNRALFEVVDRLEALLASSRSELAA
jgi:hypothetical protein